MNTLMDNPIVDSGSITWLTTEIKVVQTDFDEDLKIKCQTKPANTGAWMSNKP